MVSVVTNELFPWSTNAATDNIEMKELCADKTLCQKQSQVKIKPLIFILAVGNLGSPGFPFKRGSTLNPGGPLRNMLYMLQHKYNLKLGVPTYKFKFSCTSDELQICEGVVKNSVL